MKKNYWKKGRLSFLLVLVMTGMKAQLSGSYSVPGTHASIAAVITDLNTNGVSGAVVINIAAGYTETAPQGGFVMGTIAGVSSVNQISFQKSGLGANPLITAYTGTAISSSAAQDGIWIFSGTDYVTVDGIDMTDPNTTNPATMEFGYGFFRASATNGCQNNTVKNCVITLNKINNDAGAGPAVDGSRGIDVVNASQLTHTTALTITSAAGANSNNKFYTNTIQNCNVGVSLIGFADTTPFTFADMGNDIGGTSALTGNTIINFGGGGTSSPAAGIRTLAQYNVNVSNNMINNNNGSGVNHGAVLRGIYLNTATSANATINSNTITTNGAGTTQQISPIENASGSTAAANLISITNNIITNCTYSTATSGVFYGIYNNGTTPASLTISGNTLTNNSTNATSGSYYPIYNSGAVTSSITINNNNINGVTFNALTTSLTNRNIYNTGGGSSATLSISGNNIQSVSFIGAGSGEVDGIYNSATALSQNITNNTLTNLSINSSGTSYLIYCNNSMPANGVRTISGNSVVTGYSKTLSGGTVYGYYSFATSPVTATEINTNNNFSNINVTGSTALSVWQSADGSGTSPFGPGKLVANNTFTNITAVTGQVLVIYAGYSNVNAPGTVSNNIISSVTCSSTAVGIYINIGSHEVYGNSVNSFTSAGAASAVVGINVAAGTVNNIYKNKVYSLTDIAVDGSVVGLNMAGGTTNNIYNNLVGDLKTPVANITNAIAGISLTGGTTHNVYYNTVNINASSSGANFGTSAINVNATPTTINLRNNIFVNTSTANGTGLTVAYRRSSTALTNYASTSNNNLFYAGTPGSSNLIFHDGTNAVQTLVAYKILVSPRDNVSVTENPTFVSLIGTNVNFLNINLVIPTFIESGAAPLVGISSDYAGTARNLTTPDIGAWEGNYIAVTCTAASGGTLATAATTACVGQTIIATSNGVSTGSTTSYLWKVGVTSGGPYVPVTGGTGSTTTSYTSPPLSAGVYYVVLETTCAAAILTGISNEGTLTVNAVPTATANTTTSVICSGNNLVFSGSSNIGTAYAWTGPNSFVSTVQNPTLTNAASISTGTYNLVTTLNGCSSTVAAVSVTVNPTPSSITVIPSSATLCAGSSQTLNTNGGGVIKTMSFGIQANQNGASTSSTGYPAPYSVYYGGQRMQMLILASELTAAGFVANTPLASIQFPVVSKGANWGGTLNENQNFQVSIGNTALTSLAAFQTGLTNVVAPSNFTPSVGYNNTHTFSSPFIWNGTSNIILETTFSNNFAGTAADVVVQYNSPTTFQSTIVYRADSQTATAIAGNNTISYSYSARPDFKLNGITLGTFAWSPATGLSASTGQTVNASPAATTIYTVTAALGSCTSNNTVAINVIPTPVLNIATTSTAVCVGNSATLTAAGADTFSWTNGPASNSLVVNPSATSIYTVMGQNQNCAAVSQTINIAANPLPAVVVVATPTLICAGQNATLTAGGATNFVWVSGPLTNTYVVNPVLSTSYSVTGTDNLGCSNQATIGLNVNPAPAITIAPSTATVCALSPASFTASGATSYSWSSGSPNAATTITPSATGVYTVTGIDNNGCAGTQTVALTANPLPSVIISPASPTICTDEFITLTGSGAVNYSWSPGVAMTTTISVNPTVTSVYSIEGIDVNSCKNTMSVTVVVSPCTGIATNQLADNAVSVFPNPSTGLFTAKFEFEGEKTILIANSVGQVVSQTATSDMSTDFNLGGMAKGIYFVRVSSKQASGNYKIVIN